MLLWKDNESTQTGEPTVAKYINCGIDAHDKTLVCRAAVDKDEPRMGRFRNEPDGVQRLLKWLTAMGEGQGKVTIIAAYEASSLGFGLYDVLSEHNVTCHVLAPHKIRQSAEDRKKKTDERDAQRILEQLKNHYLAGNELPAVWIPDPELRQDRQLVRARLEVANKVAELKTQIRTFLKMNSIVIEVATKMPWSKAYRHRLEQLAAPGSDLCLSLRTVLASQLRLLNGCEQECCTLEEAAEELSLSSRYAAASQELVRQIKGVGILSAMVFLTEMGDLSRFKNRRQIAAYVGLSPTSFESGEANDRKGRITRQGPERVRKVLCQSVWCATRYDVREAKVYRDIVARNPNKKKIAVVACMRRLAIRMWHVGQDAQRNAPLVSMACA